MTLENLVQSILDKSRKVVKQRNQLSEENAQLQVKIKELKAIISNQELKVNELIEKQKVRQVAGSFGKEEKATSLRKIDEVVREIDRCMALLNT